MEPTATAAQIAPATRQMSYANLLALKEQLEEDLTNSRRTVHELIEVALTQQTTIAFWKRHYYHAQNQISRNGITPDIHITTLGAQINNYEFWEVEQLANGKLKVEREKLKKELSHLNLLYLNALEHIKVLRLFIGSR